jgi:hypothetical protein
MSSACCDECSNYIEVTNHRFPGFCSTDCRDADRYRRDAIAADRTRRRADAQQHRRADQVRRNPHYLT